MEGWDGKENNGGMEDWNTGIMSTEEKKIL